MKRTNKGRRVKREKEKEKEKIKENKKCINTFKLNKRYNRCSVPPHNSQHRRWRCPSVVGRNFARQQIPRSGQGRRCHMVLAITWSIVRGHPTTMYTLLVTTTDVRTELFFFVFSFSPTAFQLIHPPNTTTTTQQFPLSIATKYPITAAFHSHF